MFNLDHINPQFNEREYKAKLRQWQRIAGIAGVSPHLAVDSNRNVHGWDTSGGLSVRTAQGKETHTVNLDATGLPPAAERSVDFVAGGSESMGDCARYRSHLKGTAYAKSMSRAGWVAVSRKANGTEYVSFEWTESRKASEFVRMFPYWPCDGRGKPLKGKSTPTGREFKIGFDTVLLSDLYRASVGESVADTIARETREEELARLERQQREERDMMPKKLRKLYGIK